ncbi:hypothetical protein DYB37_011485 [Aphanomyces astaci]|uniref:Uncharacterized protein n=1 Tax=Aphanomyces astaci TaxID=112090 RepID=A0A418E365_APHAT|nr:hypothetical protein DYB35_011114 [Aphanomyces astaci]RHZ04874.1 hypothetical protein DYB37_011485 [Aphanomyces astaci]
MAAAIHRDRLEWVLWEENQGIVKIIMHAVKLASLHCGVIKQMALTRKKPLKKDVYRFMRSLQEYAIRHERFVEDPGSRRETGVPGTVSEALALLVPTNGCLKCKSTSHLVPGSPSKRSSNCYEHTEIRMDMVGSAGNEPGGRVAMVKTDVPDTKLPELPAIVDGILSVQASLWTQELIWRWPPEPWFLRCCSTPRA